MNRNDVIDVLTVVAGATRRTIGEADVDVWQAVIGELPVMGMVRGEKINMPFKAVRDHLAEQPGVWLEPGHVYQRVRAMIREELDREPESVRTARQEALAAKAAEDVAALAERKGLPGPVKFKRPTPERRRDLSVRCPWCRAAVGVRCVNQATRLPRLDVHPARREAALEAVS